jgi:multidrug efflux pump subunit AcrB
MDIARASIDRPLYTWIIMLVALLGGIWGFLNLGRLEDPAFTIKQAVVVTHYPGASAEQVARQNHHLDQPPRQLIDRSGDAGHL